MNKSLAIIGLLALCVVVYTQITAFVVPPIGALPEGKTIIIARLKNTEFIDSPDAICERIQGGISLLCRGIVLGTVIDHATILGRLPYSTWLYEIATGGKRYDR